ncbi:Alpha-ketoglutarate-dependent dioxygenase alkB 4 [Bulinus truncatus]|nr:Alpha-ketoglutarate-dependent dioxygenase alkB 4 [Bulinus truncatus]
MSNYSVPHVNDAPNVCGCKGIRSCRLCETSFVEKRCLQKQNNDKKIFNYCPKCERAYLYEMLEEKTCDLFYATLNYGKDNNICPLSEEATKSATSCRHDNVSKMDFQKITIIEDFISEEEESFLDAVMKDTQFQNSQSGRRKQDFGPKVNFKKQKIKLSTFNGLPQYSRFLYERMQSYSCLVDFKPVELCNLEYSSDRGAHIDPHFDDFWLWGERLVTLNLLANTYLTFTHEAYPDVEVRVPLVRRSLIVVSSDARYKWKHCISESDITGRRVAMTFRELSSQFSEGGSKEEEGLNLLNLALTFKGTALQNLND